MDVAAVRRVAVAYCAFVARLAGMVASTTAEVATALMLAPSAHINPLSTGICGSCAAWRGSMSGTAQRRTVNVRFNNDEHFEHRVLSILACDRVMVSELMPSDVAFLFDKTELARLKVLRLRHGRL